MNEPSDNDILALDVGGTKIKVLRSTLIQLEGSMLATMFSGRWDNKDDDGCIFIDQSIDLFQPMVSHLRSLTLQSPSSSPLISPCFTAKSRSMEQQFRRMIAHYGIDGLVYPMGVYPDNTGEMITDGYSKQLIDTAGTFRSYTLKSPRCSFDHDSFPLHERDVASFEVTLGENTATVHIGWIDDCGQTLPNENSQKDQRVDAVGVLCGRALGAGWSEIRSKGQADVFPLTFPLVAGTTICCNVMNTSWSVNGESVQWPERYTADPSWIPCVCIQGEFTIAVVEFQP